MLRRQLSFLCLAALVLVGCVNEAPPSPSVNDRVRVHVPEMNVSFDFHEPLMLRASADEALLSGPTTHMEVQSANGEDGLGQWELPSSVVRAIREERSCAPLKNAGVYLPVDTSFSMRCDLVLDPSGRTVLWMVGIGRPFESLAFLESSFLVLEEERYHVFWHVYPFPDADATVQWLIDTFPDRNPNMSKLIWPNRSFLLLMDEVHEVLSKLIDPPSEEVDRVMAALRDIAFSVGPVSADSDQ